MSWPEVALQDHVELLAGFAFKSAEFSSDTSQTKLLRGDNVAQGRLRWDGAKYWPTNAEARFDRYVLKAGDVVLAMDRPWIEAGLKFAWVKSADLPCLLVQRVARLRGKPSLDQTFLRYVIGSREFTEHVQSIITGANVPHISARDIQSFRFPLPPLARQQRIASVLSTYDDLIENNTGRIAIIEEIARRLFEEWIIAFRFPGGTGEMPRGWRRAPFAELADFINGFAFKPSDLGDVGDPVVKIPELLRGVTAKTPRNSGDRVPPKNRIDTGDLLFSWSATLAVNFWVEGPGLLNQHLFKVVPATDLSSAFLLLALRHALPMFTAETTGATMKHIRRSALSDVTSVVPTGDVAQKFFTFASDAYQQVNGLRRSIINLRVARDLLLPKLISGEIEIATAEEAVEVAAA